ncbi:fimbrial protein [Atlantibacter sp. RC6]|uniref:fimbrial protein n=1 Tax=Atlantibacter sp. RC6 TaxID=2587036 RepID=UPI001605EDFE|nr:fimbrial protein [Atlantibacter sp. RC6]MBB3320869.1 major type 1 subunit fimbrin (pilin) [Atlantibacter sp. RC6]
MDIFTPNRTVYYSSHLRSEHKRTLIINRLIIYKVNTNMKKLLISLAVISAINTGAALASDGVINFTGEIVDTSCQVDADSKDMTVDLGKVNKSSFNQVGDEESATKFTIKLTGCPTTATGVSGAAIKFEGESVVGDDTVLALTNGAGAATGVGVEIKDSTDNPVSMKVTPTTFLPIGTDGTMSLNYTAYYRAISDTVTAGVANAATSFTVVYN